jgi:uncharacterized protein YbbK (DUF523 family)
MKILMSSCLAGKDVMYWGGNFLNPFMTQIMDHPEIEIVSFCPEDIVLGTPRKNMLIHGGDGQDIWSGHSRLLDTAGVDQTEIMKDGARKMLEMAQAHLPDLIILTEGSASCGSQVILNPDSSKDGSYDFISGVGITAAILINNGFMVMGHKNELEIYEYLSSSLEQFNIMEGLLNFDIEDACKSKR